VSNLNLINNGHLGDSINWTAYFVIVNDILDAVFVLNGLANVSEAPHQGGSYCRDSILF